MKKMFKTVALVAVSAASLNFAGQAHADNDFMYGLTTGVSNGSLSSAAGAAASINMQSGNTSYSYSYSEEEAKMTPAELEAHIHAQKVQVIIWGAIGLLFAFLLPSYLLGEHIKLYRAIRKFFQKHFS
jgi:hypothetical protein